MEPRDSKSTDDAEIDQDELDTTIHATSGGSRAFQTFSELMSGFLDQLEEQQNKVTLGELIAFLRTRAYGVLFILFAVPNTLPMIPGTTSTIFGLPLLYIALQMLWGKHFPKLPKFLSEREIDRKTIEKVILKSLPTIRLIERQMQPRLRSVILGRGQTAIAATVVFLTILLLIPIPFSAILPAICIVLFGLSLLERDGFVTLGAYLLSVITIIIVISSASLLTVMAYLGLKSTLGH